MTPRIRTAASESQGCVQSEMMDGEEWVTPADAAFIWLEALADTRTFLLQDIRRRAVQRHLPLRPYDRAQILEQVSRLNHNDHITTKGKGSFRSENQTRDAVFGGDCVVHSIDMRWGGKVEEVRNGGPAAVITSNAWAPSPSCLPAPLHRWRVFAGANMSVIHEQQARSAMRKRKVKTKLRPRTIANLKEGDTQQG